MPDYSVFGGSLRSELPFPFLLAGKGEPDWHIRAMEGLPPRVPGEPLGEDRVDDALRVRLFHHGDGYRLEYDDTGIFDVSADGARIDWYAAPDASLEAARLDILGRVIPVALHAAGALCLHGSAVEVNGAGIAFLAPKFHGKSTLAQALVRAGARLMTDDVVALDLEPSPRMRPGVPHVRLWRDSAQALAAADGADGSVGGKVMVEPDVRAGGAQETVPLAALYLLQPVRADAGTAAVIREPLVSVAAAMALLPQARLAPLLGRSEAPRLLDRVARLARLAPVYTLRVVRGFDRIDDVVGELLAWHGGVPCDGTGVGASV